MFLSYFEFHNQRIFTLNFIIYLYSSCFENPELRFQSHRQRD